VRYRDARGRLESWYVCDRTTDSRAEPNCQSLAGAPVDEAVGLLVVAKMTPAAVDLALEIRREIEARHDEADQLRRRAIEKAQIDADLAQRRFMMVDPSNRLVADTLEADWNEKLRVLAKARDERERARREDHPRASWQKVKTPPEIVALVDKLLDDHFYDEIAEILDARGLRPGGSAWPGKGGARFTAKRVQYIVNTYGLRLRVERLRSRGLLTKTELAARLGIHETTLTSWVKHGIIKAQAYNRHAWLYEQPTNRPTKHSSRWDRLTDRAAICRASRAQDQSPQRRSKEV
jgi:hypothetical protein